VGGGTLTVAKYGGVRVGPARKRRKFNDTDAGVLSLIIGLSPLPGFGRRLDSKKAGERGASALNFAPNHG